MLKTMYHYILAFLFVSTYSLGAPTPEPSNNGLSASLSSLASFCPNPFLKEQITAQIRNCNIPVLPYGKQQYACLLFFDINQQLCKSKLIISPNSSAKLNETLDVEKVCSQAKDWSVTGIGGLPDFKEKIELILKNNKSCLKICEVEDPLSQDSNIFCKYFKWGSDMLSSVSAISSTSNAVASTNPKLQAGQTSSTSSAASPNIVPVSHLIDGQASGSDTNVPKVSETPHVDTSGAKPSPSVDLNPDPQDVEIPLPETKPSQEPQKLGPVPDNHDPELGTIDHMHRGQVHDTLLVPNPVDQAPKPVNPKEDSPKPDLSSRSSQNPQSSQLSNKQATPSPKPAGDPSGDLNLLEPVPGGGSNTGGDGNLDNGTDEDGAGNSPQDYRDSVDVQGVGGNEDEEEDGVRPPPADSHPIGSSMKGSPSDEQRELYQGNLDDDDHFFPFFLTSVIMVVLLYVLYHNKSKVSKVVLGLLVEGRQPGRRRNSRGHAYKRLDTLEQAMSTSSTAPPSKIIY